MGPDGPLVRIGLAPRAAGLSYEAVQEHWRTSHRDAALGLEGMRSYVQNHAVLRGGRLLLPYPGFDVCAETEFDDVASMRAAFASDHYRHAVREDEAKLIDGSRFMLVLTRRRVISDGEPPDSAVKLMTFLRRSPRASTRALVEVLAGPYARAVAHANPLRHEQLITEPAAHATELPACCDAVDLIWFADAEHALDAVTGVLAEHAGPLLSGTAFGAERTLVRGLRMR